MAPIRVILIGRNELELLGLHAVLDSDPDFEIVGEAKTATEGVSIVKQQQSDIILMSLWLLDSSGGGLCDLLHHADSRAALVVLTNLLDRSLVDMYLRSGARGYLLKDMEPQQLRHYLRAAAAGHSVLDPRVTDIVVESMQKVRPTPG